MVNISRMAAVQRLVKLFAQWGITDAVISPGSRNAPVVISLAAMDVFRKHVVVDERSAAFVALGIAQQTHRPVLLVCTSGSAMLNYAPALAEAHYQRLPLVVISADRPEEWIGQGEGQTIDQKNALRGMFSFMANLREEQRADDGWHNNRMINEALVMATETSRPVHLNVPLREPLYETQEVDIASFDERVFCSAGLAGVAPSAMDQMKSTWRSSTRIMVLAAQMRPMPDLEQALREFDHDPRVAVITESTANLYHLGWVCCIDRTLERISEAEHERDFVPDLLITLGENIISKKLKAFLRKHRDLIAHHWHFGEEFTDTFQRLSLRIPQSEATSVLSALSRSESPRDGRFATLWKQQFFLAEQYHERFLEQVPFSDLGVFSHIMQRLPSGFQLQMGNSSVVRYIQLFNQIEGIRYFGNRGVSGIEGNTSTALGAALAVDVPVLLITGDHAFRYDANGLSLKPLPTNLSIIVINNGGGNIFRIIEGSRDSAHLSTYIEVENHESVRHLAAHHGIEYHAANDMETLAEKLEEMLLASASQPMLLEVFTDPNESPKILNDYFNYLRNGKT